MRAITIAFLLVAATATSASAWDGPELWYDRADAASPGGGGIFGTGGQRDHRITCLDCHVERVDTALDIDFRFQPALGVAGGDATYVPGQRYRIDVTMLNETLVPPCDQYMTHTNNFAAAFENDAGQIVGTLESDSGQSQAACPTNYPRPTAGTTALYRDCETIFSKGTEDATTWTFYWTAPLTGTVRLYYGAVDGDCMMTSLGDAAINGRRTMVPAAGVSATPSLPSPSSRELTPAVVLLLALVAAMWWRTAARAPSRSRR